MFLTTANAAFHIIKKLGFKLGPKEGFMGNIKDLSLVTWKELVAIILQNMLNS